MAPRRSRWFWHISGALCRSKRCAWPVAFRATAPKQATSCAPRALSGCRPKAGKKSRRNCAICRSPSSFSGNSTTFWWSKAGAETRFSSSKRAELGQKLAIERGKLLGAAIGGLQLIETLKASGAEGDFFARWSGQHAKTLSAESQTQSTARWLEPLPNLAGALTFALVLLIGGLRVMRGDLSVGALVAFQSLLAGFSLPMSRLTTLGAQLQEAGASLSRLSDIERAPLPALPKSEVETQIPTRLSGTLELRDICFGYDPLAPPLLDGFNLKLSPGARVALVGASGSGKSTVSRLVSGLWQPRSGEILFDGRPRLDWPSATLAGSIGFVAQESWLFGGTVFENLTLWDDTAPRESVIQAAHDAQIHEVIAARAGAYESPVAENGANFSGGQRQRLEIARALAFNPSILVLDEATSALDAATEK